MGQVVSWSALEEGEFGMASAPLTFLAYLSRIRCTPEDIAELVRESKIRNAAFSLRCP